MLLKILFIRGSSKKATDLREPLGILFPNSLRPLPFPLIGAILAAVCRMFLFETVLTIYVQIWHALAEWEGGGHTQRNFESIEGEQSIKSAKAKYLNMMHDLRGWHESHPHKAALLRAQWFDAAQ